MNEKQDFEQVYRENYLQVYRYINKHVVIVADAEDITANVFVMAWKAWDRYDPEKCPIRTWLFIIASNLLKNHYRDTEKTKQDQSMDDDEAFDGTELGDSSFDEAQKTMALREVLADALETLDEREKTLIINKYFNDLSYTDLSTALSISEGNARVISTRALKKLKAYFDNNPDILG